MRNNFERFLSNEIAVELETSKDVSKFYYTMTTLNLSSILDKNEEELKNKAGKGFVVEYIPGEGFVFDNIEHVRSITNDMFEGIPSIPLINLF